MDRLTFKYKKDDHVCFFWPKNKPFNVQYKQRFVVTGHMRRQYLQQLFISLDLWTFAVLYVTSAIHILIASETLETLPTYERLDQV